MKAMKIVVLGSVSIDLLNLISGELGLMRGMDIIESKFDLGQSLILYLPKPLPKWPSYIDSRSHVKPKHKSKSKRK